MIQTARTTHEPYRFTVDEVIALTRQGFFDHQHKIELLDGEVFRVPNDGPVHILWNMAITRWLYESLLSEPFHIVVDKALNLRPNNAPSPDFYVFPKAVSLENLSGPDVSLVIEVADTSLDTDLGIKASIYAAHGIREYWVIDCQRTQVFVHHRNGATSYGEPAVFAKDEPVTARHVDGLTLLLVELDVGQ